MNSTVYTSADLGEYSSMRTVLSSKLLHYHRMFGQVLFRDVDVFLLTLCYEQRLSSGL
jgi:hypothetical protein